MSVIERSSISAFDAIQGSILLKSNSAVRNAISNRILREKNWKIFATSDATNAKVILSLKPKSTDELSKALRDQLKLENGPLKVKNGVVYPPKSLADATALLHELIKETQEQGTQSGLNVVAFSGGVDSSLAAYLVRAAFPPTHSAACIGRSASLSTFQLDGARQVAEAIGIQLWEVDTNEGALEGYVQNQGASCYFCKSSLYATLQAVALEASQKQGTATEVVLFNGTNADDLRDPTRLGLLAAVEMKVASPLARLPKAAVRVAALAAGLPNWDLAAAPCLRSRLEFGVAATSATLSLVETAEDKVRSLLEVSANENMRVRLLAGLTAVVEVDSDKLPRALLLEPVLQQELLSLGLSSVRIRAFQSGSLSRKFLQES